MNEGKRSHSPARAVSKVLKLKIEVRTDQTTNSTLIVHPRPGVAIIFIERLQRSRPAQRIYTAGSAAALGSMSIDRFMWL